MNSHESSSNAIRISLVITELEPGGAERCLTNLALGLNRSGFQLQVYSLAPRPLPGTDLLVRLLEAEGIPVHFVGVASQWQFLIGLYRLRRLLRRQQPQLVQTFLFHANVLGTLAAMRLKCCRVLNGMRVADPSRHRLRIEHWLSRRVAGLVCVSNSVADCYREFGVPAERLTVIPNGIDCSRYPAPRIDLRELGLPADRQALVYVGRLDPQKGVDWLLNLAPALFARLPDHDLLLVGDGPQRGELMQQAARLGIADRVWFVGWRPDVAAILAAAAMLVLPSRWEGMPNALLEAMATGLPVLSTRVEGVAELLGPSADAQTVTTGDADGFVEKAVHLAKDQALADSLGHQNRRRAEREFSLERMVTRYERLYHSVLNNPPN